MVFMRDRAVPIPSLCQTIVDNWMYYSNTTHANQHLRSEPTEVSMLNAAITSNLQVLLELCEWTSVWEGVMNGSLSVDGNCLMYIINNIPTPYQWDIINSQGLTVYPTSDASIVDRFVAGFEEENASPYAPGRYKMKINRDILGSDALPGAIKLVARTMHDITGVADEECSMPYFTEGRFYVPNPYAYLFGVEISRLSEVEQYIYGEETHDLYKCNMERLKILRHISSFGDALSTYLPVLDNLLYSIHLPRYPNSTQYKESCSIRELLDDCCTVEPTDEAVDNIIAHITGYRIRDKES